MSKKSRDAQKRRVMRSFERFKAQFSEAEWETLTADAPPEDPSPAPGTFQALFTGVSIRLEWPDGHVLEGQLSEDLKAEMRRALEAGETVAIRLGYAPISSRPLVIRPRQVSQREYPVHEVSEQELAEGGYLLPIEGVRRMIRRMARQMPSPVAVKLRGRRARP
jgi:hypothetical protein